MRKSKWLIGLIVFLAVIVLIVPLVSRKYLTAFALKKASETIGAPVTIANAELSLLSGGVVIHDLKVFNPLRPKEVLASVHKIALRLPLLPLLKGEKGALFLSIHRPFVDYRTDAQGNWELKNRLPLFSTQGVNQTKLPFDIEKIVIQGGEIEYRDQKVGKTTKISNLNLHIHPLKAATKIKPLPSNLDLQFLMDNQASFHLQGLADLLSPKISFDGQMELQALALPPFSPYYENETPVQITEGTMAMKSPVKCLANYLKAPAHVTLSHLQIKPKQNIILGVAAEKVVETLKNKNGQMELDILIAGDIHNPDLHLTTNVAQVFAKELGEGLAKNIPQAVEKIMNGDIQKEVQSGLQKLRGLFNK